MMKDGQKRIIGIIMKTFKKSKTFGEKNDWQICRNDRLTIERALNEYSNMYIQDEVIDDMIMVLHKMGYLKIEGENEQG